MDIQNTEETTINNKLNVEDEAIFEILESNGIEVWGQNQDIIEEQAISHLNTLTCEYEKQSEEKSINENQKSTEETEKKSIKDNILDVNKYIASQATLQSLYKKKLSESVSEKSKLVAKRISDLSLNCDQKNKKHKKDERVTKNKIANSDSDYILSENESDAEIKLIHNRGIKRKRKEKADNIQVKVQDDGLYSNYEKRTKKISETEELTVEEIVIENNLKITKNIWEQLYDYQQEAIKWLWNIHKQETGGLLGDEMGLGKTVEVITFLAALDYSQIKSYNGRYVGLGPTLIVCPATVIHQWVKHFHDWWPKFRVVLLHNSGTFPGEKRQLINEVVEKKNILITTYESVLIYQKQLLKKTWHYIILDEGHKIRNPSAKMTIVVKEFHTPYRLLLTGSPMQNNLQELWSLFDFIAPGKLGSQQAFVEHFAQPIIKGGYVNASPTQESTALLIATHLKDIISPLLLRRTKNEVKDTISLPNKSEQVLFCSLTEEQKDLYRGYLLTDHVGVILGRVKNYCSNNQIKVNILSGITTLRKICNHPDLYLGAVNDDLVENVDEEIPYEKSYGYYKRSGKMIVVAELLKIWKKQGHRVLLFSQGRGMIEIFENFLSKQGYKYLKMDGTTSIASRQPLINTFNKDSSYQVFLLTTRVGGLGINLTGANRVIIFDPDWNPATDVQARERAWRIGQLNNVTIYRLLSAGTIEEKIYQRQVWKQLLSNKILIDPRTKRIFNSSDLTELFSFQEESKNPETANLFKDSKVKINQRKRYYPKKHESVNVEIKFSEDQVEQMKLLAKKLAQNFNKTDQKQEMQKAEEISRPSPAELLAINRKKLEPKPEIIVNQIDDNTTNISFTNALKLSEDNYFDYHKDKVNKTKNKESQNKTDEVSETTNESAVKQDYCKEKLLKDCAIIKNKQNNDTPTITEETIIKHEKNKSGTKKLVDLSGKIDGEQVEGLVRCEIEKKHKKEKWNDTTQDNFILEKLFSKKGVHTALQHETIIESGYNVANISIHHEARKRADIALQAVKKSKLDKWRW